ncbi:iron ABC transporter permease [Parasphingorhabdus litoris]|uniref:Iron ABC transporter permease n=1 Tax=Parasphingorhabdus litoris TaxID=394733 RepID=A0ABP3KGE2_9SPHN|nr:iron ABC transporter permease [Parasphingorhabdus litoris]
MTEKWRLNGWISTAWGIALIAAIPIFTIFFYLPLGGAGSWSHLWQTTLPDYLLNTFSLMLMVAVIAGSIGITTAWLITTTDFPARRLLSWMLILPLAAPAYIVAYVYTDFLSFAGPVQSGLRSAFGWGMGDYWFPPIRNIPGAALMLGLVLYPYVYLLARAAFAAQSLSQFQAARSLGIGPGRAFFQIALPCARPAIAGGLALVLMETLADYGVADYFAIPTFSTGIFRNWLAMGDKQAAMTLAAIMLLFVMLLLWLESGSRKGRVASGDGLASTMPRRKLNASKAALATLCCAMPVLLGFVIPTLILLHYATNVGDGQGWIELWQYMQGSLWLAAIVAIVAVCLSLLLAYAQRSSNSPVGKAAIRVATLGYALPGALLAVGLLAPLGIFDQWITGLSRNNFGYTGGLLLTGSGAILVYALIVRFLTVSFNSISGQMTKIPPSMDAAARSLGATPGRLIRKIHMPILRGSLAAGAMLVFVDVLRELPATLILRPFNLETLATRVYRLASDERLAEASTSALLIVIAGLLPVLLLNRFAQKG